MVCGIVELLVRYHAYPSRVLFRSRLRLLTGYSLSRCGRRLYRRLHSLTLDRLQDGAWEQDETLAKCVRMAHCALADAQHAQDTAVLAGGKVTSESVGKWSRSIQQDDEQSGSFERRCQMCIRDRLRTGCSACPRR